MAFASSSLSDVKSCLRPLTCESLSAGEPFPFGRGIDSNPTDSSTLLASWDLSFLTKTATMFCFPFFELKTIDDSPSVEDWTGSVTVPTNEDRESYPLRSSMSSPSEATISRDASSSSVEDISLSSSSILDCACRRSSILPGSSLERLSLTGAEGTALSGPLNSIIEAADLALTSDLPTSSELGSGVPSENPSSVPS